MPTGVDLSAECFVHSLATVNLFTFSCRVHLKEAIDSVGELHIAEYKALNWVFEGFAAQSPPQLFEA